MSSGLVEPRKRRPPGVMVAPTIDYVMEPLFERFREEHTHVFEESTNLVEAKEGARRRKNILNTRRVQGCDERSKHDIY